MPQTQIIPKNPDTALVAALVGVANRKSGSTDESKFYQGGDGFMLVEPTTTATPDDIMAVIESFDSYSNRLAHHRAIVNWNISRLVLSLAAMLGKDYAEVVIDYGLHERAGVQVKTMINWLSVAQKLPEELLTLKLDWSSYMKAAEVMIPQEPDKAIEHVQKVRDILVQASKEPAIKNSTWVAIEMRGLKKANAPEGLYDELNMKERLADLTNLLRILRMVEEGTDIADTKLPSRTDLITAIEESESWCLKRKLITAPQEEVGIIEEEDEIISEIE